MYRNLLIATDGSEVAAKAVDHGLKLAKALSAKVTLATVSEPWSAVLAGDTAVAFPYDDYAKACAANASAILTSTARLADDMGFPVDKLHIQDQYPAEGIIAAAEKCGADLIVMGSHGRRGLSRLILGSQANRVVTHSNVPVLICR